MSTYKKMLVAIDLTEEAPQVLNKAKAMCDAQGAELLLVHVVEPVATPMVAIFLWICLNCRISWTKPLVNSWASMGGMNMVLRRQPGGNRRPARIGNPPAGQGAQR